MKPPVGFNPTTPAVDSIVQFDLSKVVLDLWRCEDRITMDGTEGAAGITQFNAFLMSRLNPAV